MSQENVILSHIIEPTDWYGNQFETVCAQGTLSDSLFIRLFSGRLDTFPTKKEQTYLCKIISEKIIFKALYIIICNIWSG
jgi:hypothetical protein